MYCWRLYSAPKRGHAEPKRYRVGSLVVSGWMHLDGWRYRARKHGNARAHIHREVRECSPSAPYGPTHICSHLELEQQLIDNDKEKGSGDVAMVASNKGKPNRGHPTNQTACADCGQSSHTNCCTTCGGWWHSAKDCYGKGGAMEGKKDKVVTHRHAAHAGSNSGRTPTTSSCPTKSASTGKPGGLQYDMNSRTYLLDAETHEAIFVATAPAPSVPGPPTPMQEFTGLAVSP
ncbi:hypothetical protein BDR06DRAFT_970013 [Suillus hirtellus]|nr:hypothetical protein BDR06DRAFT_970013 [Suillus hirtellus]